MTKCSRKRLFSQVLTRAAEWKIKIQFKTSLRRYKFKWWTICKLEPHYLSLHLHFVGWQPDRVSRLVMLALLSGNACIINSSSHSLFTPVPGYFRSYYWDKFLNGYLNEKVLRELEGTFLEYISVSSMLDFNFLLIQTYSSGSFLTG